MDTAKLYGRPGSAQHGHTAWAASAGVARDEAGYLVTGPDLLITGRSGNGWPVDRAPYFLETNVPGLFAAVDVRNRSVKRCASAVGEGASIRPERTIAVAVFRM